MTYRFVSTYDWHKFIGAMQINLWSYRWLYRCLISWWDLFPPKERYKIMMMGRKQLACCWSNQESQIILYTRICTIIKLTLYSAWILLSMYEEVATASGRRVLLYVARLDWSRDLSFVVVKCQSSLIHLNVISNEQSSDYYTFPCLNILQMTAALLEASQWKTLLSIPCPLFDIYIYIYIYKGIWMNKELINLRDWGTIFCCYLCCRTLNYFSWM